MREKEEKISETKPYKYRPVLFFETRHVGRLLQTIERENRE